MSRFLICLIALLPALSSCASLTVDEPKDGSIHVDGNGVQLLARTSGNLRSNLVSYIAGGTPISQSVAQSGPREFRANLPLGLGSQKIAVSATFESPGAPGGVTTLQAERLVCVRPLFRYPGLFYSVLGPAPAPGPSTPAGVTPQAWGAVPAAGEIEPRVVSDSSGPLVSWRFTRLGGAFSDIGVIESVEYPCRCMSSADTSFGNPLKLVTCDSADSYQRWQFLAIAGNENRVQNQSRNGDTGCITQGPAPEQKLLQAGCQDLPNQRWRFRDNTSSSIRPRPW